MTALGARKCSTLYIHCTQLISDLIEDLHTFCVDTKLDLYLDLVKLAYRMHVDRLSFVGLGSTHFQSVRTY